MDGRSGTRQAGVWQSCWLALGSHSSFPERLVKEGHEKASLDQCVQCAKTVLCPWREPRKWHCLLLSGQIREMSSERSGGEGR